MSYKFDTIVNRNEADALKEMIFRRVRERSQGMNEEVQSDVMDLARDSFVSKDNPFSNIIENTKPAEPASAPETAEHPVRDEEIGFPVKEAKARIAVQSKLLNEQQISAAVTNNMQEARVGLSNKQSFMGALNFLNSQAAISLIKTRAGRFEFVA